MTDTVTALTDPESPNADRVQQRVDVNQAGFENGALRPAQLAIFTSEAPATLVLNQIS
jgi:hypothetical protein